MANDRNNIVLIGMPGAGKSTIGILLAKQLAKNFVDTDVVIQGAEGRTLQDIVDNEGHMALRAIEERELMQLGLCNHVIATGGSAAYSERAMAALRRNGVIVYLNVGYPTLARRVTNLGSRGIAKAPNQTLADVFAERIPLYEQHADIIIDCDHLDQEQVVESICAALSNCRDRP